MIFRENTSCLFDSSFEEAEAIIKSVLLEKEFLRFDYYSIHIIRDLTAMYFTL